MPRGKKLTWSPRKMRLAIEEVQAGSKLRKTADKYGLPVMTLHDHLKKGSEYKPRLGGKPVFTADQEAEIRNVVINLSKRFYGLTPQALRKAVYRYAKKNKIKHPFNNEKQEAGKDWLYGFLKRNPEISVRVPEATSLNRITAFNQPEMELFFKNLIYLLEKHKIPPNRIFNVDESGFTTVQRPGKILAPKGQKQVGAATSWERGKNITVCCCMSAVGQYVPPLFVFPRIRMASSLERGGPPGSIYSCSKSGWMVEELFLYWLKHFVQHTKPTLTDVVLLILDNHVSHISLDIHDFCRQNGVLMLSLPPHTSHRTQPLDLTFFGPLKLQYHKECDLYMKTNNYVKLAPIDVAPLFSKAYLKVATPEKAVNGFAAAGIWPVNPDKFADQYATPIEMLHTDQGTSEKAFEEIIEPIPSTSGIAKQTPQEINQEAIETDASEKGEEEDHISFHECSLPQPQICPKVDTSLEKKGKGKGKGRKQHSEILTSTPIKEALEIKRTLKTIKTEKAKEKMKKKEINVKKKKTFKVGKKNGVRKPSHKRKILNSSTSEDENESLMLVESDDNDEAYYAEGETNVMEEICLICGEFGKDGELWYRCIVCGQWVHALCSDKDMPEGYICGFCNDK